MGWPQWKVKPDDKVVGFQDLAEGFLFSLQDEWCARRTHQYYDKLLRQFLIYAKSQGCPDRVNYLAAVPKLHVICP